MTPLSSTQLNVPQEISCRGAPKRDNNFGESQTLAFRVPNGRIFVTGFRLTVSLLVTILAVIQPGEVAGSWRRGDVNRDRGSDQAIRRPPGGERRFAGDRGRRAVRPPGILGERQEHAAADDRRPLRSGRRPRPAPWPRRHRPAAREAGRGFRVPELRAVPRHVGGGERRVRPRRSAVWPRPSAGGGATSCWSWWASPASAAACRASSPAASSSGSRWPAPWPTSPRSSFSTSPSAPSTPRCAWSCGAPSARSSASWASPPSSSPTTRKRPSSSPTGWPC